MTRCTLLLTVCLAAPSTLAAQSLSRDPHEAQPERPTVATHAGTVAPGWLEIESGFERDRFEDHTHGASVPTVFKVGLAPRVQLTVQTPIAHPPGQDSTGFGDITIGVKWRIVDGASLVGDFAVFPAIKAPTGSTDSGTGTGTSDVSLLLISSHQFGSVAMDLNVGYTRRSGPRVNAPRNAELWTMALGGPVHHRIGWNGEIYGFPGTAGPASSRPIVALLGGPTFEVRKNIVLDGGFIGPLSGPQPRAFYAGVVCNVRHL